MWQASYLAGGPLRRLHWYGQVGNSNSAVKTAFEKVWSWKAHYDLEAADREGLQRVKFLGYLMTETPGDVM